MFKFFNLFPNDFTSFPRADVVTGRTQKVDSIILFCLAADLRNCRRGAFGSLPVAH